MSVLRGFMVFIYPENFYPEWIECDVFQSQTETGSEHFAFQDKGPSRNFKLIVFTNEKIPRKCNTVNTS